ncbi:MAG: hypothetical protein ABIY50_09540 [Ignavibacteria bacterium]
MSRGNRRDAKFLIFQSLYIIAISILFYKGTDLSLNKVTEIQENDTLITKNKIDSLLKLTSYDSLSSIIKPKLPPDEEYMPIKKGEVVVDESEYNEIKRIASTKPPVQPSPQPRRSEETRKTTIEGEIPKGK